MHGFECFICFLVGVISGGLAAVIVIYDVEIVRGIKLFRKQ